MRDESCADVAPRGRPHRWSRGVTAVTAVAALTTVGALAGWAASTTVGPGLLASGRAATPSCDPAPAWTYSFGADAQGRVATVTVADIAVACAGGGLALTLGDGSGTPSFGRVGALTCATTCSATVPITDGLRYPSRITTVNGVVTAP